MGIHRVTYSIEDEWGNVHDSVPHHLTYGPTTTLGATFPNVPFNASTVNHCIGAFYLLDFIIAHGNALDDEVYGRLQQLEFIPTSANPAYSCGPGDMARSQYSKPVDLVAFEYVFLFLSVNSLCLP